MNEQEWINRQKKLDAECDDIIAHPENYEHYHSFDELLASMARNPTWQEGWYYLFGEDENSEWWCFLASPVKTYLRKFSEQLDGSGWEIWADGHKCEWY